MNEERVEDHLGQILKDGQWIDYARGYSGEARVWQAGDTTNRRIVHYISGEVLVAPKEDR